MAMASSSSPAQPAPPTCKMPVKTTLPVQPFPSNSTRQSITTKRLTLRPLREDDLQALFEIRSQPEVMRTSPRGRPDVDILTDTKPVLNGYLAPKDEGTFYFAICLRSNLDLQVGDGFAPLDEEEGGDGEAEKEKNLKPKGEGKMIGLGGCYHLTSMFGWPVVGYMIRREYWGLGLTTEFLTGWLGLWRELERREVVISVDERTVASTSGTTEIGSDQLKGEILAGEDGEKKLKEVPAVPEQIVTWAVADNIGSWRVMEKAGFEHLLTWKETDLRDPSVEVELKAYRYFV